MDFYSAEVKLTKTSVLLGLSQEAIDLFSAFQGGKGLNSIPKLKQRSSSIHSCVAEYTILV